MPLTPENSNVYWNSNDNIVKVVVNPVTLKDIEYVNTIRGTLKVKKDTKVVIGNEKPLGKEWIKIKKSINQI
jgi:hypothetical protein